MRSKFIFVLALAAFLSAGCATQNYYKSGNPASEVYFADLNGDGMRLAIEIEKKTEAEGSFLVTVRKNNKAGEAIDSCTVPGRFKKAEFAELNMNGREWMVLHYGTGEGLFNIGVYQLSNNSLSKIFFSSSEYGIETVLDSALGRIRIGKVLQKTGSPNLVPKWESWVWAGDEFVRE